MKKKTHYSLFIARPMTDFVNRYYIRISYIALQGPDETDRRVEDSKEQLESNGDLNGGSGLLVEPRERKKGEVTNFAMMMMILMRPWLGGGCS